MSGPSNYQPTSAFGKWMHERLPIYAFLKDTAIDFPTPKNLNYFWTFGGILTVMLVVQILTGIILVMHYTPHVDMAFASKEHIIRNVNYGWMIQKFHEVGASMFFIAVYIHMFRGMYYGSYKAPREVLWMIGVIIYLIMMATAFMGYVLPWGQMSFWGAQVITGFFSAIPLVGEPLRQLLLGGFAPDNAALNRFFSLHYLLPFITAGVIILHIWALHIPGSNNPTGLDVKGPQDTVPFHPYYTSKDGFGLGVFLIIFAAIVFYAPNMMGHPDNYIPANSLSTPAHIVPEWYFLPFYAILKAFTFNFLWIDAKLWGVIAMFGSILLLFFLPWLDTSPVRSSNFRPMYKWFFWVLVADVFILGVCGMMPAEEPWVRISQVAAMYYFAHFLIILPIISRIERPLAMPNSITEAVLTGSNAKGGILDALPIGGSKGGRGAQQPLPAE